MTQTYCGLQVLQVTYAILVLPTPFVIFLIHSNKKFSVFRFIFEPSGILQKSRDHLRDLFHMNTKKCFEKKIKFIKFILIFPFENVINNKGELKKITPYNSFNKWKLQLLIFWLNSAGYFLRSKILFLKVPCVQPIRFGR